MFKLEIDNYVWNKNNCNVNEIKKLIIMFKIKGNKVWNKKINNV